MSMTFVFGLKICDSGVSMAKNFSMKIYMGEMPDIKAFSVLPQEGKDSIGRGTQSKS
jgi:hypothetical protein